MESVLLRGMINAKYLYWVKKVDSIFLYDKILTILVSKQLNNHNE